MSAYKNSYDTVIVDKTKSSEIKAVVDRIQSNKSRYQKVASELHPNTPYWFVGVIHQLEAGGKFDRHLHNGDPLSSRTTRVPSGRPKTGNPPFTWEYSALDALKGQTNGDPVWRNFKDDWSIDAILQKLESYNGLGYKRRNVDNPYLWSYTNYYSRGKFVADGTYDPNAVSRQPGAAAIIKTKKKKNNETNT